jgi:hypothetical protein
MKDLSLVIKIFRFLGWSILSMRVAMSKNNQWFRKRKSI